MPRLPLHLLVLLLVGAVAPLHAGDNLVRNPSFADGLKHWMTAWEGSGYYGEENGKRISLVADPTHEKAGKVMLFDIPPNVAANEGVAAATLIFEVQPYAVYEFGADVYSTGTAPVIFLEGYRANPEQTHQNYEEQRGYERFYRASIHVKNGRGSWATQKRRIDLSDKAARYQPTHVQIKLYAYYPAGKVYWTNVYMRMVEPPPPDKVKP